MNVIEKNRKRQDGLVADSNTLMAAAEAERRDLTKDETDRIKANAHSFEKIAALIKIRESVAAQEKELDRVAKSRPSARVIGDRSRLSPNHGFDAFGDFVMAVRNAGSLGGKTDGRLMAAAATSYGNEGSGTDGGFAIPPDFRSEIMDKAFGEDSLISRTDQQVISGNSLTFPSSMTTPWGTTGAQARWTGEAAAATQDREPLQEINIRLNKLSVLVPMTEELLEDAPAMGTFVAKKAAVAIDYKLSDAIVQGREHGTITLPLVTCLRAVPVAGKGVVRRLPDAWRARRFVLGIGKVSRIEGDVAEKAATPILSDEFTCGLCKNIGTIPLRPSRFSVAIEVVATIVDVGVIITVAGDVTEVLIESPVRGSATRREAEIPFAKTPADISCLGEIPW